MSISKAQFIMTFVVCLFLGIGTANALEPLNFSQTLNAAEELRLKPYLEQDYIVAKQDLNEDGLSEYILRSSHCSTFELCDFLVLAQTSRTPSKLLEFKAKNLAISDEKTSGVRDLIVYQNPKNDFDYSVFSWQPQSSTFVERAK